MVDNGATSSGQDSDLLTGSLVITHPIYKFALIAFVIGCFCAVAWALYGSIPHRVEGLGEINTTEGLFKVTAVYRGQIVKKIVNLNENVEDNQNLFLLRQPEIENSILEMKEALNLLKIKKTELTSGNKRSYSLKSDVNNLETKLIKYQITETKKNITFLKKRLNQNQKLYDDGLVTYSHLFKIQNSLAREKSKIEDLAKTLQEVTLSTQEWMLGKELSEKDLEHEVIKLTKKIKDLKKEYLINTEVNAPVSGTIVQLNVEIGDEVTPGMHLATIEVPDNSNKYLLDMFVPYSANAEIKKGMRVEIEPFTVDQNLYGWLKGKVIEINRYVSSEVGLANELANRNLAGLLGEKGPVYKVTVKLLTDSGTVSGFAWSNKKGPPFKVNLGTLCKAYVKVKDKAPIDFLIPIFKGYFE